MIPSTEDKDFQGQVSKHEDQEQTPGREGAQSPDLFSVDESEMEVSFLLTVRCHTLTCQTS